MQNYNQSLQFPTLSEFSNRIIEAEFVKSKSSGNPMVHIKCEVVAPTEYEIDGENVNLAGVKTDNYYTTQHEFEDGSIDGVKTEDDHDRVMKMLFTPLDIEESAIDWDNINVDLLLKGKVILTQMSAEVTEQRKTPTKAQVDAAKAKGVRPVGDIMKNPKTGRVLIQYKPVIKQIFGVA